MMEEKNNRRENGDAVEKEDASSDGKEFLFSDRAFEDSLDFECEDLDQLPV
jgi:hypothetical protein